MIIRCSACSTHYAVDEAAFGTKGRAVKCTNCGHRWVQAPGQAYASPLRKLSQAAQAAAARSTPLDTPQPSPTPATEKQVSPARTAPEPEAVLPESTSHTPSEQAGDGEAPPSVPEAEESSVSLPDDAEESPTAPDAADENEQPEEAPEAEAEEVEEGKDEAGSDEDRGLPEDEPIPEVFKFPHVQPEPPPKRRFPAWAAAVAALVPIALGGALYLAKEPLGMNFPVVARAYDAIGIQPYRAYGLDIPKDAVKTEYQGGGQALEVSGIVLNTSDRERPVPDLKISFLDAMGKEVQSVITSVEPNVIPPRQQIDFVVLVENTAATATRLSVVFADSNTTRN